MNAGVTTLTFSTSFTVAASSTVNYILIGNAVYLASGDTMTMALGLSNISLSSGCVGGSDHQRHPGGEPHQGDLQLRHHRDVVGGPDRCDQHHRQGLGRWRRGWRRGR